MQTNSIKDKGKSACQQPLHLTKKIWNGEGSDNKTSILQYAHTQSFTAFNFRFVCLRLEIWTSHALFSSCMSSSVLSPSSATFVWAPACVFMCMLAHPGVWASVYNDRVPHCVYIQMGLGKRRHRHSLRVQTPSTPACSTHMQTTVKKLQIL